MRLDRFLSDMGVCSRTQTKKAVRAGLVSINGAVVKKSDAQLEPERDSVVYMGEQIKYEKIHLYHAKQTQRLYKCNRRQEQKDGA
ncbi:MAG: S4 domain-containing protein [Clostridia bacterium]|nr:S4 domain-containing protein [Clostridia bacterium]